MKEDQFIPHLIVKNGLAALEFYKTVFGGSEGDKMMAPDGTRLMHGEVILTVISFSSRMSLLKAKEARANRRKHSVVQMCESRCRSTMLISSSNALWPQVRV